MIALKIYPDSDNNVVIEQITSLLRQRHRLKDTDEDDFQITDMKQIMDIADSGNIMPPKATWFEPKLRSGLIIHSLD